MRHNWLGMTLAMLAGNVFSQQYEVIKNFNGPVEGVNQAGTAVGTWRFGPTVQDQRAFIWRGDFGALLSGANGSFPQSVNSTNTVVGFDFNGPQAGSGFNAVYWPHGGNKVVLPLLSGHFGGQAFDVNDAGTIVGVSGAGEFESPRPVAWNNGIPTALSAVPGIAYSINNVGQVVGQSQNQAAQWQNGQTTLLGNLGGTWSSATDINNNGVVVGWSTLADNNIQNRQAFLWQNGSMASLGVLEHGSDSVAYAINDSGEVVGTSFNPTLGLNMAFLYKDGQLLNLNHLLPGGSGWYLSAATDINNAGEIVGRGIFNGQETGFLIAPIPEASTFGLLATGLILVAGSTIARRRRGEGAG